MTLAPLGRRSGRCGLTRLARMPTLPTIGATSVMLAACLAVSACGSSDDGLSRDQAQTLRATLQSAGDDFDAGDPCAAADDALALSAQIDELGPEVDAELRNALSSGAENLAVLTGDACAGAEATETTDTTPETTETTDTTETTATETTETTETTTEPTETTETTDTEGGGGVEPGSGGAGPG